MGLQTSGIVYLQHWKSVQLLDSPVSFTIVKKCLIKPGIKGQDTVSLQHPIGKTSTTAKQPALILDVEKMEKCPMNWRSRENGSYHET